MGFFSGIKSTFKKSEAAVVVQNLFEIQAKVGIFQYDPAKIATHLVAHVWDQTPDIFEGKFGVRPHKLAVAAVALGNGFFVFEADASLRASCLVALGEILKTIGVNGELFQFNNVDHKLFESAMQMFTEEAEQAEAREGNFLG